LFAPSRGEKVNESVMDEPGQDLSDLRCGGVEETGRRGMDAEPGSGVCIIAAFIQDRRPR